MTRYRNRPLGDHSRKSARDFDTPEDAGAATARSWASVGGGFPVTKAVEDDGTERGLTDSEDARAGAAFEHGLTAQALPETDDPEALGD
jgi:hypothetical protein